MKQATAIFGIGQIVGHKLFDYRGVIIDVDAHFQLDDDWYREVALSRPPKDRPWYSILVDGQDGTTYVAERNLRADPSERPIDHPLVPAFFSGLKDGRYQPVSLHN